MAASPAREAARRALRRVETEGAFANLALDAEISRARLSPADRGLATELVYGVLRHRSRLDRALRANAARGKLKVSPKVSAILRVAAYQLLFLDRVPAHAAVDDAVGAARSAGGQRVAGFVNGLLRALSRAGEPAIDDGDVATRASLPRWIYQSLRAAVPGGELAAAAEALNEPAPLCARVSGHRVTRAQLATALREDCPGAAVDDVEWLDGALWLRGLGEPGRLASFRDGLWTVQDAAAQAVGHLLDLSALGAGDAVLDACAGQGGKATHLAQQLAHGALDVRVVAADISAAKLGRLRDVAARLKLREIETVAGDLTDPAALGEREFAAVVIDAPCSGLGVLRRHPETKWRERADRAELHALQAGLLDALADRVAPGGQLVYAVCTFEQAEGPGAVESFLERRPDFERAELPEDPSVDWAPLVQAGDPPGQVRIWPHRCGGDAFFAARLRRTRAS